MITRIVSKALPFVLLLLCSAAFGQNVTYNVVLTASGTGANLPIQSETINGQPLTTAGTGWINANVYNNSSDYGEISIAVPPDQPFDPNNDWYYWYVPTSQVQRGTPIQTSNVMIFTETDTFNVTDDITFYQVWTEPWTGSLARTLQLHERCGRWPCRNYVPIDQCTPANRCYISFTDLSDTATINGNFPQPVAP